MLLFFRTARKGTEREGAWDIMSNSTAILGKEDVQGRVGGGDHLREREADFQVCCPEGSVWSWPGPAESVEAKQQEDLGSFLSLYSSFYPWYEIQGNTLHKQ